MKDLSLSIGLPSHIKGYMEDRQWLAVLAPSGFSLVINHTPHGSEYFDATYSVEWQEEYVNRMYLWADPVVLSTIYAGNNNKRWSEIKTPDVMGVMASAKRHGMKFGARIARRRGYRISFCALAREDREFTDDEIQSVADWFDALLDKIETSFELSEGELEVIKCIGRGMTREQASAHLSVSYGAIKKRLKNARTKTGCSTDQQLVARLVRRL
ncbi:helix-turn-helix transcriptional regulator [Ruegeria jejuensis]|uniref:helix-turn-helix transcriptional regulator n=1 Tax=Ruegeria jejuensis TaxID=3233338 RepID=UPI00355BD933